MCLYPRVMLNKKYVPNKKNKGVIPKLPKVKVKGRWIDDERVRYVPIGCGKCMECKKQKANEWRIRLNEEVRGNKKCHFVTLTFSNESIKKLYDKYFSDKDIEGYLLDNEIAKKAVRLFLERWRKKTKRSVKHWFITELGHEGSENIHLHGFIWTDRPSSFVNERWGYGFVWDSVKEKGFVNEQTVNYVIKYCTKRDLVHKEYEPIILCSPAIGKSYFNRDDYKGNKYKGKETEQGYKSSSGHRMSLPIYYRNKIYSDNERELLWRDMLDKNERFVDGVKIRGRYDEDDSEYYRRLEIAREKNKRLGFGDDSDNWDRKQYEREKRRLNHKKRGID